MVETIRLGDYFDEKNVICREELTALKPSPRGLNKLKERLGLKDWRMMYIGDGYDDYLSAKGANVFFAMITQGLVRDIDTIRGMKRDSVYGGELLVKRKLRLPKFIVAFNYDELAWWFSDFSGYDRLVRAVCFDLGDTIVVGGRGEAYELTDKNWPNWEADKLLEGRRVKKDLRGGITSMKVGEGWRKLGELPSMNSSEVRIITLFLLEILGLKQKELATALYSEVDDKTVELVSGLSERTEIPINMTTIPRPAAVKDIVGLFQPEQFSLVLTAGLLLNMEKRRDLGDVATIILAAMLWIEQYRKYELEAYKKHSKVPRGLREFLDILKGKGKTLCIFTSKSREITNAVLENPKEILSE
jgi:phosphoglycolate phosphatase-like HAD superfamily hydrolase